MGQVISLSEPALDYLLYGDQTSKVTNYLYNQIQALPKAFNGFAERVYNSMLTSYNYLTDHLVQHVVMTQLQDNGLAAVNDYYRELTAFNQFTQANLTMQRWVMAHPGVKELYNKQAIDGYSETYTPIDGNGVGENDYNYRRVMNNGLQDTDEGWKVQTYIDELYHGDRELNFREKVLIRNSWDAIDHILHSCKFDFTVKSTDPVERDVE